MNMNIQMQLMMKTITQTTIGKDHGATAEDKDGDKGKYDIDGATAEDKDGDKVKDDDDGAAVEYNDGV